MDRADVDLWTISLANPSPAHLSPDEIERANRFRFEVDRVRWTRARSSLRLILSRYAGDEPSRLAFIYGEHGKPALLPFAHIEFNLSHAGDWAMIAVTHSIPVGVDIERLRPDVDMVPLLRRLGEDNLPDGTQQLDQVQQLYQVWTRREAKSKADGGALFNKPPANICVVDVTAPAGYAASVALVGYEPNVRYCAGGNR
jgi:4'-phosphopantetheinyl transferase